MSPLICFIHGANSSPISFNYIKADFAGYDVLDVAYGMQEGALNVADRVAQACEETGREVRIVSHSLGGLVAAAAAARTDRITAIASMGTPYGGWRFATFARWLTNSVLLNDIHPGSDLVRGVQDNPPRVPVLAVVTTGGGNPFLCEPNDGVVGIASQRTLSGATLHEVTSNHFEVLLSPDVRQTISDFITR